VQNTLNKDSENLQGVEEQKTEHTLIVSLASATVRAFKSQQSKSVSGPINSHVRALLLLRNLHHGTSDNRTSQTGTEEVDIFVDGVALNGREAAVIESD